MKTFFVVFTYNNINIISNIVHGYLTIEYNFKSGYSGDEIYDIIRAQVEKDISCKVANFKILSMCKL